MIGSYFGGQAYPGRTGRSTFTLSLSVSSTLHGQSLDDIILTQQHLLSIEDVLQSQSADGGLVLVENKTLFINDVVQSQTLDDTQLIQHYILEVLDALHSQSVNSVDLVQNWLLVIANMLHDQTVGDIVLSAALIVSDVHTGQALDDIIIGIKIRPVPTDVYIENQTPGNFSNRIKPIVVMGDVPVNAIKMMSGAPVTTIKDRRALKGVDINP